MPKFLNETNETGDGILVKLGDEIEVDLYNPIKAIVTSIVEHYNGKIFITGKQANEKVDTWPASIVQQPTKIYKGAEAVDEKERFDRWTFDYTGDLSYSDWKKKVDNPRRIAERKAERERE